ncbi:MAG: hypothetical protein NTU91_13735 [Chloroflexi bacterium]|nr:hypothetical protein [Chloroflexota bacterium]
MRLHTQSPRPVRAASWTVWLALGLPVLVAVALMVPRVCSAQFGLFDDANSISVARQTWTGQWDWEQDIGFGRFRPVYWLVFSLIYRWAGYHASWYFVGNLLLLLCTTLLLGGAVLRLTRRPLAAGIVGLAFVLGGPVVEAAYTLSKPELAQCFFLTASAATLALAPRPGTRFMRVGALLMSSVLVFLAALTKETTGLLLGIAPAWVAIAWASDRVRGAEAHPHASPLARDFLLACALGITAYLGTAFAASPGILSGAGPRANFTFTWATIETNTKVWLDLIVRDWLQLLPLVVAAAYCAVSTRRLAHSLMMLGSLVWMGAWFALYLPYRFTPEYYLLPFSLGAAVFTGLLALQVVDASRAGPVASFLVKGCGALAAVLILLTIPNNLTNGGIQLSVDKANTAMLEFVAENAPADGLVLVNIRADIEYLWNVAPMLHSVYNRPDLTVEAYPDPGSALAVGSRPTMVISPFIENVPLPSVRLGIPEEVSRAWEAALQEELGGRLSLQRETRFCQHLLVVDAPRLICLAVPQIGYCQRPHTPFDTRRFAAGWRIYSLSAPSG